MSISDTGNVDTAAAAETGMPSMLAGMQSSGMDTTKYRVRVGRFEIDADLGEVPALELLYTRGIDGSNDVVILKEKTFTNDDIMVVVVFYMEKRLGNDPSSVLKTLRESEED